MRLRDGDQPKAIHVNVMVEWGFKAKAVCTVCAQTLLLSLDISQGLKRGEKAWTTGAGARVVQMRGLL